MKCARRCRSGIVAWWLGDVPAPTQAANPDRQAMRTNNLSAEDVPSMSRELGTGRIEFNEPDSAQVGNELALDIFSPSVHNCSGDTHFY